MDPMGIVGVQYMSPGMPQIDFHLSSLEEVRLISLKQYPGVAWFLPVEAYFAEGHRLSLLDLSILEHRTYLETA